MKKSRRITSYCWALVNLFSIHGQPSLASIICARSGEIRWMVSGKEVYEYYGQSSFSRPSQVYFLRSGKKISGIASRRKKGVIVFQDNKGRYVISLMLTGVGEGYQTSLIDNGSVEGCGLY